MMRKQSVRQQLGIVTAIAEARQEAGLSKRELSVRLGETNTFMQKIENGGRNVAVQDFIRIARAIGIDPCELLRRALR